MYNHHVTHLPHHQNSINDYEIYTAPRQEKNMMRRLLSSEEMVELRPFNKKARATNNKECPRKMNSVFKASRFVIEKQELDPQVANGGHGTNQNETRNRQPHLQTPSVSVATGTIECEDDVQVDPLVTNEGDDTNQNQTENPVFLRDIDDGDIVNM